MASTITLQKTIAFAQAFCRLQPLAGVGQIEGEPALTIANNVRGFILGPPFAWRWNRATKSIPLVKGTQDYVVDLPDLGWVEKASVSDGISTWEIPIKLVISDASEEGRPQHVAPQMDDGGGNVTFRMFPVPDAPYTLKLIYQVNPPIFEGLEELWTPVPDDLAYIFNEGFLAMAFEMTDDPRFTTQMSLFLRHLIAANAGLEDSQKNLFLESRIADERQRQSALMGSSQGRNSRGA